MTTFTTSVAASADDAQESTGTTVIDGTNLNANSASQLSAMRFTGVTVPPGSTVIAPTYATINVTSTSYDDPDVSIRSSLEANPAAFAAASNHLTNRPKSTNVVNWNAAALGAGAENTPDLAALIQETIDQAGWASGNALALYIIGKAGSALRWNAYDNGSGQAQLTITYNPPSAAGASPKTARIRLTTRVGGLLTA
jgi:hypothetical protein